MIGEVKRLFAEVGITSAEALDFRHVRVTGERILGECGFDPKSVLMFAVPYYAGETVNLSRYAASVDYHLVLREITAGVIAGLKDLFPECRAKGYGDHSPIDERLCAAMCGIGVFGDNGLMIHPTYGSYIFLGDILTDLPPETVGAVPPEEPRGCEHCGACKRACPTGILRGESDSCLSAVTQRKGELTEEEIGWMKKNNTVWGCDLCQTACPHNRTPEPTPIRAFYEDRIPELTPEKLNAMTKPEFERRAFAWRGRNVLRRNLRLFYGETVSPDLPENVGK